MAVYYAAQEDDPESGADADMAEPEEAEEVPYTGPRTLDGRPAPQAIPTVGSSSRSAPPKKKGGVATLSSLSQAAPSGSHAGHGHAHDDDDDSDDEDYQEPGEPRDLFAGGEKSGLAVQDPNHNNPERLVSDIMKKARA